MSTRKGTKIRGHNKVRNTAEGCMSKNMLGANASYLPVMPSCTGGIFCCRSNIRTIASMAHQHPSHARMRSFLSTLKASFYQHLEGHCMALPSHRGIHALELFRISLTRPRIDRRFATRPLRWSTGGVKRFVWLRFSDGPFPENKSIRQKGSIHLLLPSSWICMIRP